MACLDEVTFKIPLGSLDEVKEEVELVKTPEISMPDYLNILKETEYVFSLENWVLTGLQGGYNTEAPLAHPHSPSETLATCPPYWMMFSSPQESRLASRWSSDLWEPNPRPRSRSLNAAHYRTMTERVKFTISDSEDESFSEEEETVTGNEGPKCSGSALKRQGQGVNDLQSRCSSNYLGLPSSCSLTTKRRANGWQTSLSNSKPLGRNFRKDQSISEHSVKHSENFTSSTTQSRGLCSRPPLAPPRPLGSHATPPDSSVELLSALSPEERQLLEAVTERGYPLRTAIMALQKTGQRSPEQILSYLVACERLCERGYDAAQVEEALEMFQNCETKAEQFLHLLTQFHEMGFQQNTIKEVLLVHENHGERALEELMTRVA